VRIACDRERAKKERKERANASFVAMRSWSIIKVLENGPVNSLCVILKMLLILQSHSTDLALKPIPFFNMGQMLPLKVLC
jgi:hypothetical protein